MFNAGVISVGGASAPVVPVTWVGGGASRVATNGASLTVSMPAAAVNGDFLVAVLAAPVYNDLTLSLTSSGWTKRIDHHVRDDQSVNGINLGVFTKVKTSADTSVQATGLITGADTYLSIAVFRGVNVTTPLDVSMVPGSSQWNYLVLTPSITPVTSGSMVYGGSMGSSFFATGTVPSSLAVRSGSGWINAYGAQRNTTGQPGANVSGFGVAYNPSRVS